MPTFATSTPSSPTGDANAHGPDGAEDQIGAAVWKRRYFALQESMNTDNSSKRKSRSTPNTGCLGRGIRKMVFLCGQIKDLVCDSDNYCAYVEDPDNIDEFDGLDEDEVENLKRNWERSHTAIRELNRLIPNFQKKFNEASPEELSDFCAELQRGANSARSDDLSRIRACIAEWLNTANPPPSPLLDTSCRKNRGLAHDTTGELLCPAEFDWSNLVTRAKIRSFDEDFDWLSSYHSRCFYKNYNPDVARLEFGYLKSTLLVKVYKTIFTSPSSAKNILDEENDAENMPPTKSQRTSFHNKSVRRNVASKLHLNNKVTPRSVAYAAVQLHFNLQTAGSWTTVYDGFDYQGLYNYVVDVFENTPGPAAKKRAHDLLNWWSMKIFPAAAIHRQLNTTASRKAFKEQRAALEREEAA